MSYAHPIERAAIIRGLRALADYLEANTDVPTPICARVYTFAPNGECKEMRAEIDVIAKLLGSQAHEVVGGQHYTVTRSFGPVEYHAVAICEHHDHNSAEGR